MRSFFVLSAILAACSALPVPGNDISIQNPEPLLEARTPGRTPVVSKVATCFGCGGGKPSGGSSSGSSSSSSKIGGNGWPIVNFVNRPPLPNSAVIKAWHGKSGKREISDPEPLLETRAPASGGGVRLINFSKPTSGGSSSSSSSSSKVGGNGWPKLTFASGNPAQPGPAVIKAWHGKSGKRDVDADPELLLETRTPKQTTVVQKVATCFGCGGGKPSTGSSSTFPWPKSLQAAAQGKLTVGKDGQRLWQPRQKVST